jgi:hypothetical protein
LKIIDGLTLPAAKRALLRPDEEWTDPGGVSRRLPRFFYLVETWAKAKEIHLTEHFTIAELIAVDCREAPGLLREFPHFVPCALRILARYLEEFRRRVDGPVYISVNGGYRSPAHRHHRAATPHAWGSAADIYRVGDGWIDSAKSIERYGKIAESIGRELRVKPFGHESGATDDHLHLDLGFLKLDPHAWSEDEGEP